MKHLPLGCSPLPAACCLLLAGYAWLMLAASFRKHGVSEDFLRHTKPIVRTASVSAKGRTRRLFIRNSLRTASVGNSVTPAPPATMLMTVGRLVPRN